MTSFPCFVGLTTLGAEVAVPGYTRQPAILASTADGVTAANTEAIVWPHALADWGFISGVQLWSAPIGGARLGDFSVVEALFVGMYDIIRIPVAGIIGVLAKTKRAFGVSRFGTSTYGFWLAALGTQLTPTAWGVGGWGMDGYAARARGAVTIELEFVQQHVCAPGQWAPGPFSKAA